MHYLSYMRAMTEIRAYSALKRSRITILLIKYFETYLCLTRMLPEEKFLTGDNFTVVL
jgi:hypothetical protein